MITNNTNNINKSYAIDLVKLLACIQVFLGHSTHHLQIENNPLLIMLVSLFQGVPVFFMISGYLIWESIDKSKNFFHFIKKRIWRLYPELWLAVLLSAIAIIAIKPEIILIDKFVVFCIMKGSLFQFWTPECLKSYGCGTPNGALWTIGVMVQSYIVLYFVNKFNRKNLWGG